jgi:hypothetical protein
MIPRKTYAIGSWRRWALDIDKCVRDFEDRFGVTPNVLLANNVTFQRINMAADKSHVGNAAGDDAPEHQYVDITGFAGADYVVAFAVSERLADRKFALMYDDDPDGGEPWPDEDNDELFEFMRAAE